MFRTLARVAQQGRGVVDRHIAAAVYIEPLSVLARDAKRVFDERRCSDAAEADNEHRIDKLDLPLQPFAAALLLRKSGRLWAGDLTCKGNPTKVSLAYISSDGLIFATYDHYATFVEIV